MYGTHVLRTNSISSPSDVLRQPERWEILTQEYRFHTLKRRVLHAGRKTLRPTAQEEYGLRCLLHLSRSEGSCTIGEIAEQEALSPAYVAKLMRLLRQAKLVESARGKSGGYRLSAAPDSMLLSDIMDALGERFHSPCVCERYSGQNDECVHLEDCSIRALWVGVDRLVHGFLSRTTLADLVCSERAMNRRVKQHLVRLPKAIG
ncbi:MAG: Rrf2 family transcriptional regulator [Polyangiales bacterium]